MLELISSLKKNEYFPLLYLKKQDGKYYMLMNDVVPGTIVKIGSSESGKTIYAKVLGAVPPGKESEGLALRLSNAAAAALGMQEGSGLSVVAVWFK